MFNEISKIIMSLTFNEKITLEEVEGKEEQIIEIINKAKAIELKEFIRSTKNGEWATANAENASREYIVNEIKKLNK